MEKIKIHFVCRGNIYRSRLAEAYLKSFQNPKWVISSSGIDAEKQKTIHTSPWAEATAIQNGIAQWLTGTNTKTVQADLDDSDLIVFMSDDVYRDVQKTYTFNEDKSLVWHVKDRQNWPTTMPARQKRYGTFRQIKRNANTLIDDITAGGKWIDIIDEHNQPRGFKLPIQITNKKSLWHRGCHVVMTTPSGRTFIQQRSNNIIFAPGLVDVTLGGHVDTGETPEEAAIREIHEEMGVSVDSHELDLIEVSKWNYYRPRYKTRTKAFIYTYHVRLTEENPAIVIQEDEVRAVRLLSPVALRRLLRYHRLVSGARLNYSYAYYSRITKQLK